MASENDKEQEQSPKPHKPARKTKRAPDPAAKGPAEPSNRKRGLTVVGLGASAGGLAALQAFFEALSGNTGMAFVVVTHLYPDQESHLAELLQRHTSMPAIQVTGRVKVESNHVYVIPPNYNILMADSHLNLAEFTEPHGRRTPIDHFFRSLAAGHSESIAVILSGGGTDGSVGVKDIKEQGGLILVQDPNDAEYDSMPRAAISTGLADVVLPASQLAQKLMDYVRHFPVLPHDPGQLTEQELETLQRILAQVHARTGHDFNQYKRSTVLRRVERRMQLNGFTTLESYLNFLRGSADEAHAMFNDILIGVTNFFRDRDSWATLEEMVIPELFKKKNEHDELRVWSLGCATGEEAYGLGILLLEHAARLDFRPQIQIFASDLDDRSIAHAREGLYPAAIEADVSPHRLERFFTREGEYYRVKRELRDTVLFTNHNVLRDPPFSRQDLIACRNVLIYLQRPVQERVFDIFHYALNPEGYLFLGTSESAEHLPDLFDTVDRHHRIYRARRWAGDRPHVPSLPLNVRRGQRGPEQNRGTRPHLARYLEDVVPPIPVSEEMHRRALETLSPPSVIVNNRYAILHVSETAGRYLLQPKGPITGDLLRLVRPELQLELRTALFQAFEKNQATISRIIPVQFNGHTRRVVVAVRPQGEVSELDRNVERQALVLFLEDQINAPETTGEVGGQHASQAERDEMVAQLQSEVQRLREQLQITIEEYDSSNEEMKAANEELQSINEEYRSATEELETSKEELQSVNEELQTVNSEMRGKLDEITGAHRELENLMAATEIPTLFLDRELRIQRYTAGIKVLFNIQQIDRGRRISDLTHKLGYPTFFEDAEQVLRRLQPIEREAQMDSGGWFLIRIKPYRTVEDKIEGVVITFIDISKLKQAEEELIRTKDMLKGHVEEQTRELHEANRKISLARDLFYSLFHANPIPAALVRIEDGMFLDVNAAYLDYLGVQRDDIVGHSRYELALPISPDFQARLLTQLRNEGVIRDFEIEIDHPSGERRKLLASVQQIEMDGDDAVIGSFIDITERVQAEEKIRSLATKLTAGEQAERQRMARVLHDELQQKIFAVKMQLTFLGEALERNDVERLRLDLKQLDEWLAEAIATTRQLSIDLSPPILHGEGLAEALIWLAAQMKEQYGLEVTIDPKDVNATFDEDVRVLLFQSVRELLFNVVKHAGTLRAEVSMAEMDGLVRITVNDDGKGFDGAEIMKNGIAGRGLLRMRDRLVLLGCDLTVQSKQDNGTKITIEAPIKGTID